MTRKIVSTRLRKTWRGKLVLQVSEMRHYTKDLGGSGYYDDYSVEHWRDATTEDFIRGDLKWPVVS